jgi:hypothetical protein
VAGGTVDGEGEPLGAGPPPQAAPLIVQPEGWPADPDDAVTKLTVTEPPGAMVASQSSLVTVTCPERTV